MCSSLSWVKKKQSPLIHSWFIELYKFGWCDRDTVSIFIVVFWHLHFTKNYCLCQGGYVFASVGSWLVCLSLSLLKKLPSRHFCKASVLGTRNRRLDFWWCRSSFGLGNSFRVSSFLQQCELSTYMCSRVNCCNLSPCFTHLLQWGKPKTTLGNSPYGINTHSSMLRQFCDCTKSLYSASVF